VALGAAQGDLLVGGDHAGRDFVAVFDQGDDAFLALGVAFALRSWRLGVALRFFVPDDAGDALWEVEGQAEQDLGRLAFYGSHAASSSAGKPSIGKYAAKLSVMHLR